MPIGTEPESLQQREDPLGFHDLADIRAFLRTLMFDPHNMSTLRRELLKDVRTLDVSRLHDHEVIDLVASRVMSGSLQMAGLPLARAGVTGGTPSEAVEEDGPDRAAPMESTDLTWVKFQVVDDETGQPIENVKLTITLPSGKEQTKATNAEGLIEIRGIQEGSCALKCELAGGRLETTRHFVGTGAPSKVPKETEEGVAGAGSQPLVIARIDEHKVKTGESLSGLAESAGLTWQALAEFNWDTSVPSKINEHLCDDVGCTKKTADGKNYVFDDSDDPGTVYIPRPWTASGLQASKTHTLRVCEMIPEPVFEWEFSI